MNKVIVAAVAAAALLVPAAALAAKPAKNSYFQYCTEEDRCPFGFETSKNGKKIVDIKLYPKCNPVPATWPEIRVKKGKFSASGKVENVLGKEITYVINGKFTSRKKAVGTYEVDAKGCDDKPVEFVAKRVGKAQKGF